jgi:hypothetical protein
MPELVALVALVALIVGFSKVVLAAGSVVQK